MPLLEVSDLYREFKGRPYVNGISFDVEHKRCVALLGPNGAGKTTTLRMLAGMLPPTRGSIRYKGEPLGESGRREIGYLPQSPAFYTWMTGEEYMHFAARLSGIGAKEAVRLSADALERLGLQEAARRRIGGYSGGMKQRLGLAQALVHSPRLLLLDEPVSALDPFGRREVMDILREIRKDAAILFSTHVLHDAEALCDDIILMNKGMIAERGELSALKAKYTRPVLSLRVEKRKEALEWLETLSSRPFVREAWMEEEGLLRLEVEDMESARSTILREAGQQSVPVLRFERDSLSLEDVFMKAVGQ